MCLYPKLIKNRKYVMNKKNGGVVPPVKDERTLWVPVGCGECMECRKQKSREWQVRLSEEVRHDKTGKFITLTFSNESIKELARECKGLSGYNLDNWIAKRAVRKFLERWRKKYKRSAKHWLITELGHKGTENIHMHGIIWTRESMDEIERIWKYGHIWKGKGEHKINYVNEKTIGYLVKYVSKQDKDHKYYKPKVLTSPGIGSNYMEREDAKRNKFNGDKTREHYTTRTGTKLALPIYYRNKTYTEEEREQLWLQKLDKGERWVMGKRVDISKGEENYWTILKEEQAKNKRLGYGDGSIDWEKKNYENELRRLKLKERIAKAK